MAPELTVNRVRGVVWLQDKLDGPLVRLEGCQVRLENIETDETVATWTTNSAGRFDVSVGPGKYVRLVFVFGRHSLPVYIHVQSDTLQGSKLGLRVILRPFDHECGGTAQVTATY